MYDASVYVRLTWYVKDTTTRGQFRIGVATPNGTTNVYGSATAFGFGTFGGGGGRAAIVGSSSSITTGLAGRPSVRLSKTLELVRLIGGAPNGNAITGSKPVRLSTNTASKKMLLFLNAVRPEVTILVNARK